jgi:L-lysine 2,3-aminomutase
MLSQTEGPRFRALTVRNIVQVPEWSLLPPELQEAVQVVAQVLPFRTNSYVTGHLIDWQNVEEDPIFQLTFPQRGMLEPDHYQAILKLLQRRAPRDEIIRLANRIRLAMNPHPSGQREFNIPHLHGRSLPGLQHKYRETVLFFPAQGQTCHAYCTYCFRWAQFVDLPELRFSVSDGRDLWAYLKEKPEVLDLLVTGGDPMIANSRTLRQYLEPLLSPEFEHVQNIRIGTKAPAYWPYRWVTDPDADDLLRLFEQIVEAGRHLALMVHYSHPVELSTDIARECIRRIRNTGAEIRIQSPIIQHVNAGAAVWRELCNTSVRLGMIPYYMFLERDTGPKRYFELPLIDAYEIFAEAYRGLSGLARTIRGPIMSTTWGKVRILGRADLGGRDVLVLDFIQARNPEWVGKPFFAEMDGRATWFDQLRPAFEHHRRFFGPPRAQASLEREPTAALSLLS